MAQEGLRVLGVARGVFEQQKLPGEQHDFSFEFLGLVGLADPVRPTVPAAVEECYTAGIRVVMITGDHPTTAKSIARQAGIRPVDEIITGPDLEHDGRNATCSGGCRQSTSSPAWSRNKSCGW